LEIPGIEIGSHKDQYWTGLIRIDCGIDNRSALTPDAINLAINWSRPLKTNVDVRP